jgi:sensor c-di-GMP phosphodiesterase-like protein
MLVAGAVLLVALPVVGTLYFAHAQTLNRIHDRLALVAETVAEQTADVLLEAEAALASVVFRSRRKCTPELVQAFINTTMGFSVIQDIGYLSAGSLLECTSYGLIVPPIRVNHNELIKPEGAIVWFAPPAETPYALGITITAIHRLRTGDTLVAAFAPHELVRGRHREILGMDSVVEARMAGIRLASHGTAETQNVLTVSRNTGVYETEIIVMADRAAALAPWRDNAIVIGSVGGIAGLLLAVGAAHLARRRPSPTSEIHLALPIRDSGGRIRRRSALRASFRSKVHQRTKNVV